MPSSSSVMTCSEIAIGYSQINTELGMKRFQRPYST